MPRARPAPGAPAAPRPEPRPPASRTAPATPPTAPPAAPGPLAAPPAPQPAPQPTAPHRRGRARTVAAALCLVLGVGLLGGAATGAWLNSAPGGRPTAAETFTGARELWHSAPVDTLFPPTLKGEGAGPGGADRVWIRAAVAPDSGCAEAFDELLAKALAPVGCDRLLRATYVDETSSSVTTVGVVFTEADRAGMRELEERFAREGLGTREDLMPRAYAARGTPSAGFGDAQRATWTVRVRTDLPVVVYAVTGFADQRTAPAPQPAAEATREGETSAVAQAGLGHAAEGVADLIETGLRDAATRDVPGDR
ncbi:hypothetical protein WDH52_14010 [Streptomyces sp. TRM70308]|uniref:hypothetical protein n=1 Tax=Streptomyces sp. TRM70308 TaxID=3131932 RepID=UPI003CFD6E6D